MLFQQGFPKQPRNAYRVLQCPIMGAGVLIDCVDAHLTKINAACRCLYEHICLIVETLPLDADQP